jgi:hypothetical protein
MTVPRRLRVALLAAVVVACAASGSAAAETIVRHDAAGRAMTFDVRASGADVDWYASLLARAAHGDEIATVTIRIVPAEEIHDYCGRAAAGCYTARRSPTLTVPAGRSSGIASVLLHEYAHHLDAAWEVDGVREPNGTPAWWALRAMAEFRRTGAVADDYSLGWSRGIGEIFAEDYAYIHLGDSYGIQWLKPPSQELKRALLAELRGETVVRPSPGNVATMTRPVTITDSGTLEAGASHEESFRLLGPKRRVTFTAAVSALGGSSTGGRALVRCNGSVVKSLRLLPGRQATLDVPRLGPASCSASLVNTGTTAQRFSFRLRLAIQP